jgi:hypothetical protein
VLIAVFDGAVQTERLHRPNETELSDGHRGRASLEGKTF